MGEYFQVSDDYLDNFADPAVLGKIGTDIQDRKCSWLAVEAIRRCNAEQLSVLKHNYGLKDKEAEHCIKVLYNELRLEDVYRTYEDAKVAGLRSMISEVDESEGLQQEVFEAFLRKIYKRSK